MSAKYRVWWIPQIPGKAFNVSVDDAKTAVLLSNVLADYDLFQFENRIKPDYSNAGGVEVWDEEESEWLYLGDDELTEILVSESTGSAVSA